MTLSSLDTLTRFVKEFDHYFGKPFEVVTGRNGYAINKNRHVELVSRDGIYLLLENEPRDTLKHKYDKALFIPARTVDRMLPTNDPAKIKKSFSLAGDLVKLSFNQQIHKLYQANPCIVKVVEFEDTRRSFAVDRKDYEFLNRNKGFFVYIYTVKTTVHTLLGTRVVSCGDLFNRFDGDAQKEHLKSVNLRFELPINAIDFIDSHNMRNLLVKERKPEQPSKDQPVKHYGITVKYENDIPTNVETEHTKSAKLTDDTVKHVNGQTTLPETLNTYLVPGTTFRLVVPEGKNVLVLDCTITKQERKENTGDPPK